ncbi:MAG TPA: LLM class flavin-dependent oxidoreductase, partial [Acidimicrobiia bacterium]|nr:LLM class flavin-dependent oxidoreductase [Acidimicrobiia bacterium]
SPDEVVAELTDLVTTLPVDPLLVRPQWPTMDGAETVATIDTIGRHVVPAMREIDPKTDL